MIDSIDVEVVPSVLFEGWDGETTGIDQDASAVLFASLLEAALLARFPDVTVRVIVGGAGALEERTMVLGDDDYEIDRTVDRVWDISNEVFFTRSDRADGQYIWIVEDAGGA